MMMKQTLKYQKIKGVSLLTALIFSFVLMVVLSALSYNYRVSSLAIDSLTDDMENLNLDEGYIDIVLNNPDLFDETIDDTVGISRFVTDPSSITPIFYHKNSSSSLYQADPLVLSYNMTHHYYNNGVLGYVKNMIMNQLTNDTFVQYDENLIPLNIPYLNIDAMTSSEKIYKLTNNDTISDSERGYIGYIQRSGLSLTLVAMGTSSSFSVPSDLSTSDYKLSFGWNLKNGLWDLFILAYDTNKAYTSSTSLRNMVDNSSQASTQLADWQGIVSLPSGSSVPSGSIILTKWYHDEIDEIPKPLVLRKEEDAVTPGSYNLAIYNTTVNSTNSIFTAASPVYASTTNDFDTTKVFMVVPDEDFKLKGDNPLIFQEDGGVTKVMQFNLHDYDLVDYTASFGTLSPVVDQEPIMVKRNTTQSYVIYSSASAYYSHLYSAGSFNMTAIAPKTTMGTIEKLIPKFGGLFVVTSDYIYVDDFDTGTTDWLNRINRTNNTSAYQILRANDGLIYTQKSALDCTIQGNCNSNNRLFIRTAGDCASYGGCDAIDELNNIAPYIGLVYQNIEH